MYKAKFVLPAKLAAGILPVRSHIQVVFAQSCFLSAAEVLYFFSFGEHEYARSVKFDFC